MVQRGFWKRLIEEAFRRRSVVWLSGARRSGKTYLSKTVRADEYFDCELPRVRRTLADPEAVLSGLRGKRIVLDEIHRLGDPSEFLKIAADHYPDVKVLATGSSTLGASAKFRDTLTGRKTEAWLTPMVTADLEDFGNRDMARRFQRGGLPPFFLSGDAPERDFQEWMDSYWAKDIQELFRLERRHSFMRFTELLMAQSGGLFEATRFARACEVSRTTISNYLAVLEATFVVHVLRPFSSSPTAEIVSAPKTYGFDTGFVCYYRGWNTLRPEDMGLLWEHYVLNEIQGRFQRRDLRYWRDKRGHEVDFVIVRPGKKPIAIECKWSAGDADPDGMASFGARYPRCPLILVAHDVDKEHPMRFHGVEIRVMGLERLIRTLRKLILTQ